MSNLTINNQLMNKLYSWWLVNKLQIVFLSWNTDRFSLFEVESILQYTGCAYRSHGTVHGVVIWRMSCE